MQNNFREFEELVFFDLWVPIFPVSGLGNQNPVPVPVLGSGFRVSGFPLLKHNDVRSILRHYDYVIMSFCPKHTTCM